MHNRLSSRRFTRFHGTFVKTLCVFALGSLVLPSIALGEALNGAEQYARVIRIYRGEIGCAACNTATAYLDSFGIPFDLVSQVNPYTGASSANTRQGGPYHSIESPSSRPGNVLVNGDPNQPIVLAPGGTRENVVPRSPSEATGPSTGPLGQLALLPEATMKEQLRDLARYAYPNLYDGQTGLLVIDTNGPNSGFNEGGEWRDKLQEFLQKGDQDTLRIFDLSKEQVDTAGEAKQEADKIGEAIQKNDEEMFKKFAQWAVEKSKKHELGTLGFDQQKDANGKNLLDFIESDPNHILSSGNGGVDPGPYPYLKEITQQEKEGKIGIANPKTDKVELEDAPPQAVPRPGPPAPGNLVDPGSQTANRIGFDDNQRVNADRGGGGGGDQGALNSLLPALLSGLGSMLGGGGGGQQQQHGGQPTPRVTPPTFTPTMAPSASPSPTVSPTPSPGANAPGATDNSFLADLTETIVQTIAEVLADLLGLAPSTGGNP